MVCLRSFYFLYVNYCMLIIVFACLLLLLLSDLYHNLQVFVISNFYCEFLSGGCVFREFRVLCI